MVTLKLGNGTKLSFNDGYQGGFIGIYHTYAEVDDIRSQITNESLVGATIINDETGDITELVDVVTNGISTFSGYDGELTVHYNLRPKTEVEILEERIATIQAEQETQNEAIDFLVME